LDELIDLLGDKWPQMRRLTRVRDLSQSPSLLSEFIEHGATDFDVLIRRAQRLRNSIAHGGPQEKGSLRTVTVRETITDVSGKLRTGPPKTRASVRTVALPSFLAEDLAKHATGKGRDDLLSPRLEVG
jgi:hypothetical protein